jgi:molybdate transport system ATP-binding protein
VLVSADHLTPGPVFAAVQPRAVAVHRARPEGSARNAWSGRVSAVEPVGDRFRIQVDAVPPVVAEVTGAAVRDMGLREGADVWVAIKATEIDVYPA